MKFGDNVKTVMGIGKVHEIGDDMICVQFPTFQKVWFWSHAVELINKGVAR